MCDEMWKPELLVRGHGLWSQPLTEKILSTAQVSGNCLNKLSLTFFQLCIN